MTKNTSIKWNFKHFSELSAIEWYAIAKKRIEVFIIEQECQYLDLDNKDLDAYHIYGTENEEVVAYTRLLDRGVSYEEVSIGRVLVTKKNRGTGLGHELMHKTIQFSEATYGKNDIRISAQQHLADFYEVHSFKRITKMYLEDNIPHVGMLRQ